MPPTRILLVSGSTRDASTNTAALRTIQAVAPDGVTTTLYDELSELPAFNPDDDCDPLHPVVARLRVQIAESHAVVFCTPEYAGCLPGSFKNLLDWTVGGGEVYGKPVAWVNVAAEGRGRGALASLVTVLGYVGAGCVETACRSVSVPRAAVGPDGLVADEHIRSGLAEVLHALVAHLAATPAH